MDPNEEKIRQMIAANSDDGYIDVEEERIMATEAGQVGLGRKFNDIITEECLTYGIVREKTAAGKIHNYLTSHQDYKDGIKKTDIKKIKIWAKRELIPAENKNKQEAGQQLMEKADHIISEIGVTKSTPILAYLGGVVIILLGVVIYIQTRNSVPLINPGVNAGAGFAGSNRPEPISALDQQMINKLIEKLAAHVKEGRLTYPPEECATSVLKSIRRIDRDLIYRKNDIEPILSDIVGQYLTWAKRSHKDGDLTETKKWLGRAKLFDRDSELISSFEKKIGLLKEE